MPAQAARVRASASGATGLHNLPLELTSFVGREDQIQRITAELARSRLVTLTGTGGCGKTRLACQVAQRLRRSYSGGAWFVDLGQLTDPKLVPDALPDGWHARRGGLLEFPPPSTYLARSA